MASEQIPAEAAALIGPGGPYEVVETRVGDADFRLFRHAPRNLGELYREALAHGDQDFYVYEDERYTFADAYRSAQRVSEGLRRLGVQPGDRVGIAMRNYPEWLWAFMGITDAGAVAVCMNAWWTGEEMMYAIRDSGLRTLFVDRERLEHLGPFLEEKLLDVIAVRTEHTSGRGVMGWERFLDAPPDAAAPQPGAAADVDPEDYATLLYTSGSTAHPKGVISTHRAVIHALLGWEAAAALAAAMAPASQPSAFAPAMILTVPLFHVTGLNVQFLSSLRPGRKLVGMYKWDADKALAIIERERITDFNGVPTMAYELVRSANFGRHDLSSLKSMGGGGAAMAPEHSRRIAESSAGRVAPGTGYGMTETNGLATAIAGADLEVRPRSCGKPLPPVVDVKIVDPDGNEVPRGETGEIWIRGPMNFSGYWDRPDDTARTLTEGWVHTGDVGHMDEDDYVFITDRIKDMVIRGGENIGCQEVEAVILDHAGVEECVVFGVPDERLGETLAAVVKRVQGSELTAGDVRSHVGEHLARFKVPEYVWVGDEALPRIASGKLNKRGIRQQALEALASASTPAAQA